MTTFSLKPLIIGLLLGCAAEITSSESIAQSNTAMPGSAAITPNSTTAPRTNETPMTPNTTSTTASRPSLTSILSTSQMNSTIETPTQSITPPATPPTPPTINTNSKSTTGDPHVTSTTGIKTQTTSSTQEEHKSNALGSGSIAGIVCVFLIIALLLLGGLYYYKIRRTSYGPLLDSSDYGTLGNFSNPIYESS
ncbi:hypothetical protein Q5P01_024419 [Channa striata]|uniref:Prostate androgen-regulated mucin-like protein 1 n=1 Tax=Channa striata TaxID=64152 RepID=A0AA88ILC3_CHASR|nr:hypothetical protein Q5P01_024419 [Channa striata]